MSGLFGPDSGEVSRLLIFMMFYPSFFFLVIPAVLRVKQKASWRRIVSPVFLATLLAIVLKLTSLDVYLPVFMKNTFMAIGSLSTPLIFLILGGNIYLDLTQAGRFFPGQIMKFILIKNFLFPAIGLLVLKFSGISQPLSLIIILQLAVPPLTIVPVMVGRAGGNRAFVNQLFVASALTSIVSLPVFLQLFYWLGL